MVKDTADANDHAVELLELAEARVVLEIGFGQGRTAAKLVQDGIGSWVSMCPKPW